MLTKAHLSLVGALSVVFLLSLLAGCSALRSTDDAAQRPTPQDETLDALHAAASAADEARYFALFAPEAVFIGTDTSEIWTLAEFRAYAHPLFAAGKGWTYRPRDRHVHVDDDAGYAFFEERVDNDKYGECRGTGVLRRIGDAWKIAQYSLSVPIPNDLLPEFAKRIREGASARH